MVCTLASNRYVCAHMFYVSSKLGLAELVCYQEAFAENYYVWESTFGERKCRDGRKNLFWGKNVAGTWREAWCEMVNPIVWKIRKCAPPRPLYRKPWWRLMADDQDGREVGQPQPWHDVDATQNHGGGIGFSLAMVHFFRFQLSKSL